MEASSYSTIAGQDFSIPGPTAVRLHRPERVGAGLPVALYFRQYLPQSRHRLHPYASSLVSVWQAGVPTQVVRFAGVTHAALATLRAVLDEVAHFLRRRLWEAGFARQSNQYPKPREE